MLSRIAGKLCFAEPSATAPREIQVMLSADGSARDALVDWKRDVEIGDHMASEARSSRPAAVSCPSGR